jgi:hypothetical protein
MDNKVIDQPAPQGNAHPAIADLVVADLSLRVQDLAHDALVKDILDRKAVGIERYGVPLQPFNGRDPLVDAYQECIDGAKYLRQLLFEVRINMQHPLRAKYGGWQAEVIVSEQYEEMLEMCLRMRRWIG